MVLRTCVKFFRCEIYIRHAGRWLRWVSQCFTVCVIRRRKIKRIELETPGRRLGDCNCPITPTTNIDVKSKWCRKRSLVSIPDGHFPLPCRCMSELYQWLFQSPVWRRKVTRRIFFPILGVYFISYVYTGWMYRLNIFNIRVFHFY